MERDAQHRVPPGTQYQEGSEYQDRSRNGAPSPEPAWQRAVRAAPRRVAERGAECKGHLEDGHREKAGGAGVRGCPL